MFYSDKFMIRYWETEYVTGVLAEHGFSLERNLGDVFSGAGSQYLLMKKTHKAEQGAH